MQIYQKEYSSTDCRQETLIFSVILMPVRYISCIVYSCAFLSNASNANGRDSTNFPFGSGECRSRATGTPDSFGAQKTHNPLTILILRDTVLFSVLLN